LKSWKKEKRPRQLNGLHENVSPWEIKHDYTRNIDSYLYLESGTP